MIKTGLHMANKETGSKNSNKKRLMWKHLAHVSNPPYIHFNKFTAF